MQRRVESADFAQAYETMVVSQKTGLWSACKEYELHEADIVAKYRLSRLEEDLNPSDVWWNYSPLEDAPDLFLKFGRLYKEENFEEAALAFSHQYGLPDSASIVVDGEEHGHVPAEKISISHFRDEAEKAYCVLALYEAVLNGEPETVKTLSSSHRFTGESPESYYEGIALVEQMQGVNGVLHVGLDLATDMVQEVVNRTCRQRIDFPKPRLRTEVPDLSTLETVWEFDSLVGAMYLQMWWLIASGDSVARCEYCGRLISLARPHPEGRKRRSDKRFCNDACRQARCREKKQALDY